MVSSAIEHPAVAGAIARLAPRGVAFVAIGGDRDGRLDLDRFATAVRAPGTMLATVQHANHEIGTMQQIGEAARLARAAGVPFHTDAVQTVGRLPIDVRALEVDLLTMSGHTFGGPPGVGALYVRRGVEIAPTLAGRRPGARPARRLAEPPGDRGDGGRAHRRPGDDGRRRRRAHGRRPRPSAIGSPSCVPGATIHGHPTHRVPHLVCFSVAGLDAATFAMALDDRGVHLGAGAPGTGRPEDPSAVLAQLGFPETPSFRIGVRSGDERSRSRTAASRCSPRSPESSGSVARGAAAAMARFRPPDPGVAA